MLSEHKNPEFEAKEADEKKVQQNDEAPPVNNNPILADGSLVPSASSLPYDPSLYPSYASYFSYYYPSSSFSTPYFPQGNAIQNNVNNDTAPPESNATLADGSLVPSASSLPYDPSLYPSYASYLPYYYSSSSFSTPYFPQRDEVQIQNNANNDAAPPPPESNAMRDDNASPINNIVSIGESSSPSSGLQLLPKLRKVTKTLVDAYLHHDDQGNNLGVLYVQGEGEFHGFDEKDEYKIYKEGNHRKGNIKWKARSMCYLIKRYDESGKEARAGFGPFVIIYNVKFYNEHQDRRLPSIASKELPEYLINHLKKRGHSLPRKRRVVRSKKRMHTYSSASSLPQENAMQIQNNANNDAAPSVNNIVSIDESSSPSPERRPSKKQKIDQQNDDALSENNNTILGSESSSSPTPPHPQGNAMQIESNADNASSGNNTVASPFSQMTNADQAFMEFCYVTTHSPNILTLLAELPAEKAHEFFAYRDAMLAILRSTLQPELAVNNGLAQFGESSSSSAPSLPQENAMQIESNADNVSSGNNTITSPFSQMTNADQALMEFCYVTTHSPNILTLLAELPAEKAHEFFAYRDAMLAILRSAPQPEPVVNNGLAQFGLFSSGNNQAFMEPSISSTTVSSSPESSHSTEMPKNV